MDNSSFNEEIQYINGYYERNGFKIIVNISSGYESKIYQVQDEEKKIIYYGKKYKIKGFINPYREFLLEINIKSSFSIKPIKLYIKNDKYYIIMEIYKNLDRFFNIYKDTYNELTKKKVSSEEQKSFDKYLNILLVTVSLLQAVLILHVQKIPIIHHDLKPGNVLMSEYQYDSEEKKITKINIKHETINKHILHHIYFANLIDFGLTKENISITMDNGTPQYRSRAKYLESSDLLSIAIIMKILIHRFRINIKDTTPITTKDLKHIPNFVYDIVDYAIKIVDKFYYKNTKILKGLDRVINILANLYYKRRSNIFDILEILTNREKMETIISEDFKSKNKRPELVNRYFDILNVSHIIYTYNDDFRKIAPKIYGDKYDFKAFLFALFHQKNNDFDLVFLQSYQAKIVDLYEQNSENKYDLFNRIADYHYQINFFSFKQLFTNFSEKFSNISDNSSFTINSKLFKILTSLNFKETRSLNHFSNALHLSLFSVRQEVLYNLLVCFGKDYEAKIGFLLHIIKTVDDQDPFELLIRRARHCSENRQFFFDNIVTYDSNNAEIKIEYNEDIKISDFQLITSDFDNFLKIINKSGYNKDECIKLFEEKISTNKIQNENMLYLHDYNDDAIFLLFIHYLYFFEIKDEKLKLQSFSEDSLEDKSKDDDDGDEEEEEEEEEEEWIIENETKNINQGINIYSVRDEYLINLKYDMIYSLEDPKCKEKFIWLTLFRLGDLIDDVLSQETIQKLQNYILVIKFLKSTGLNIVEFHIFLDFILKKNIYDQFQRIAHNFSLNHKINPVASKLQFLESISYFSNDFFNLIFDKISNEENSNNDLLEFISLDKNETVNPEINNYSDIRTKINFPYVIYPFGKINYLENKSIKFKKINPTLKSKITVCITHTFNYLTNLPFKIPIQIKLNNILVDEKNGLPIMILETFDQLPASDQNHDYYNYENVIECLKSVVKHFYIDKKDNKFLKIILNYSIISNYENIKKSEDQSNFKSLILFQYIFNLFLDPDSLDLTFKGTDLKEFKDFINNVIKNEFYDDHFQRFAYELLGQSYAVKLDYLFTRMKLGSNLTKEKFVDELNKITSNSSLLTLIDDTTTLANLSNLFERYFIEDSYNLVHRLNQLVEKDTYKVLDDEDDRIKNDLDCKKKYDRQNLDEEKISYIYHINNKFVSPMKYSTKEFLYFKVSSMKYDDDIMKRFGEDYTRTFNFFYSLQSAVKYLQGCKPENLLPKELTLNDIYINEMDEAIILPYNVNNFIKDKTLESIKNKLRINEHSNSIICYSYASYIPLKNHHSHYLMKIFGFDYSTELNEIVNSTVGFFKKEQRTEEDDLIIDDKNSIDDKKITDKFNEKCEEIIKKLYEKKISLDEHILDLSSNTNKLTPLFIHLLEKAKESKDVNISAKANKRLEIYMSIKEIKEGLVLNNGNGKLELNNGGESKVCLIQYNGKVVAFKKIKSHVKNFLYLQKMKNTLYLLKIEDKTNDYVINEIGFTNFGMIMDLYKENLFDYINRCKKDLMNDTLKLFKIILRITQIINFLHSKNLVHCDIKLNNFLLNNENEIFIGDMLNVRYERAFSKITIFTFDHHSNKLTSLKHQDVYAFEVLIWKLFNENGIFCGYKFPLLDEYIVKNKDTDENIHYDIKKYHNIIISERMYILKIKENETDVNNLNRINEQYKKITKILVQENEISVNEKKFREIVINNETDFKTACDLFTNILEKKIYHSKLCLYLTDFARKLHFLYKKLEKNENFLYIILQIDTFIKEYIDDDFKNLKFDPDLDELIYERIYIHNNIDINEEYWHKYIFHILKCVKNTKLDKDLYPKLKNILKILDEKKDMSAGFFYNYLLFSDINDDILTNDIEIKKNAICFFYNYYSEIKKKININDFKILISEIFKFLISNPSNIEEFKIWLIGNQISDHKIKPQNINIISMFFYFYFKNRIAYKELNSAFDDTFYIVAEELINATISVIEIQPVNTYTFLKDAIDFRNENGQKLAYEYQKYVLPPFQKSET